MYFEDNVAQLCVNSAYATRSKLKIKQKQQQLT